MDSRVIIFIITFFAVIAALMVGVAVGMGEAMLPQAMVLGLVGVLLIARPEVAVFITVALFASGLGAPGIGDQLSLYDASTAALIGCAIIAVVFRRNTELSIGLAHRLVILFGLLLFITGFARGFGIRFLGGDLWGGFNYIKMFLAIGLVFTLPMIRMPARAWRFAILAMALLSAIPLAAQLLMLFGINNGLIQMLGKANNFLSNMPSARPTESVDRVAAAGLCAQSLLLAMLAVVPTRKLFQFRSIWTVFAVGAIITLSFLSGFRLMTVSLVLCLAIAILIQKTLNPPRVIMGVIIGLVGLLILYQVSDSLPRSMQRALSWLPGITISQVAAESAEGTVSWRLDLWHEAAKDIPQYFLLGKGFGFNGTEMTRIMMSDPNSIYWALVSGAYHNGYLSLLLLFGIGGLVLGLWILVAVVWRHWKLVRARWNNPSLQRAHQAFFAFSAMSLIVYLTIYGDVASVFPQFFYFWAIMESLRKTDEFETPQSVEESSVESSNEFAFLE